MKLSKTLEAAHNFSKSASNSARYLSLLGIYLSWSMPLQNYKIILVIFIASAFVDLLQYHLTGTMWKLFYEKSRKAIPRSNTDKDPEIYNSGYIAMVAWVLFHLKVFLTIVGWFAIVLNL